MTDTPTVTDRVMTVALVGPWVACTAGCVYVGALLLGARAVADCLVGRG